MNLVTDAGRLILVMSVIFTLASCDICSATQGKRPPPCPLAMESPVNMSLNCDKWDCNVGYCEDYRWGSNRKFNQLTSFEVSQCLTDYHGQSKYLGMRFSWSVFAGDIEDDSILQIAVEQAGYPREVALLHITLTSHLTANQTNNFSTVCVPLNVIITETEYNIIAKLGPVSERRQNKFITIDCDSMLHFVRDVCPAPPKVRPYLEFYCEESVPIIRVVYTANLPPGIGTRSTFNVTVGLRYKSNPSDPIGTWNTSVQNRVAKSMDPRLPFVLYANVSPGIYEALFAFNDESGEPCGRVVYTSESPLTVSASDTNCKPTHVNESIPVIPDGEGNMLPVTITTIVVGVSVAVVVVLVVIVGLQYRRQRKRPEEKPRIPEEGCAQSVADTALGRNEHMDRFLEDLATLPHSRAGAISVISGKDSPAHNGHLICESHMSEESGWIDDESSVFDNKTMVFSH